MDGDPTVAVIKRKRATRKTKETGDGFLAEDESSGDTGDEDVYKPQDDESDSEEEEEEGRSEDVDEQELKELGTCGNSTTELVLDSFKDWLQGIDGGDHQERSKR